METQDTCLYIHTRKDNGGIFYVGIGDSKRPYSKYRRNKFWHNVVKKHDFVVTILKTDMSWKEACDLEINMIAFYGRRDNKKGCLVNMTNGGEGAKGLIVSEETKQKTKERMTGKNNPNFNKNISGKNNPNFGNTGEKNPLFGKQKPKHSIRMSGKDNPKATKVICIVTGKIYGCIKDAAEDIGVNYGTLRDYLRGKYTNKTSLRFV